jgi:O-antigen/teichoic acid export membrane protein
MSLLKNSTIVVAGLIIANILAYIFHIYVGRSLGPEEYGAFGALMALFMVFALPAGSISYAITKFTAKFNSEKDYSKIGFLRQRVVSKFFKIGVILFIAIASSSKWIANYLKLDSITPLLFVSFILIFSFILPINRGVLQGMKKFKIYFWNVIIEAFARILFLFLFIFIGFKVNGAILAYGLGYIFAFLAIFPFIKETKLEKSKSYDMGPFYKFIFLVLIVNILLQAIINLPTIFIKHFSTSEFTGYWTSALTITRATLIVTTGITMAMFPEISGKTNHQDKKRVFKKAFLLTTLASLIIAMIFWFIPDLFILLLYGPNFLGAISLIRWMGLAMVGLSMLQVSLNYLLARRN